MKKKIICKDNMQRHMSREHNNPSFTPFGGMFNSREKGQRFQFIHPFTCMIAGATGSGKTAWVQTLLQQAKKVIEPTTGEDCLVLLTWATRLHGIGGNDTANRIRHGYST